MFGYVSICGKQSCPFSRQDMQVLLLVCRWRVCPFLTAQISCWQLLWWWRPWPSFPTSHLSDPTVSIARRGSRWIPLLRPDFTATCRLSGHSGVPIVAQWVKNPADILEDAGLIPGLAQWGWGSGIAVSCGVGYRLGLDPTHIAVVVVKANSCSSSSTPSLGTSICLRRSHKKKNRAFKGITGIYLAYWDARSSEAVWRQTHAFSLLLVKSIWSNDITRVCSKEVEIKCVNFF